MRFVAEAIDRAIVDAPLALLTLLLMGQNDPLSSPWWLFIIPTAMGIAYYGISEGLWGASIGKRLVRLRVVIAPGGQTPTVAAFQQQYPELRGASAAACVGSLDSSDLWNSGKGFSDCFFRKAWPSAENHSIEPS
jgi:RDD family